MKDLIDLTGDPSFDEVKAIIDDYMSYYNNERYQWDLAKLSPNEYFSFVTTGVYPLDLPSKPSPPEISKTPNELGAHTLEPEIVSDPLIRACFVTSNRLKDKQYGLKYGRIGARELGKGKEKACSYGGGADV